jgi:hypothetical protein
VLDDRLAVRGIRLRTPSGERLAQARGDAGKLPAAAVDRASGDQREAEETVAPLERQLLGDAAAHRDAGDVRAWDPQPVEHGDRIGGEVGAGVAGGAGRIAGRAPGVAVVVAHDEATALRQAPAQVLVPVVHGAARAGDEQDRGRARVADRLDAELRAAAGPDRPLLTLHGGRDATRAARARLGRMCRNIRQLHNFDPPATDEEIRSAALQYVRKISGYHKPSQANAEAFERAVDEVAAASARLLAGLTTAAPPKDRDVEAAKARARAQQRYAA